MQCPSCKSTLIVYDPHTGETYCAKCGLIIDDPLDLSLLPEEIKASYHEPTSLTLPWKGLFSGFELKITRYKPKLHEYISDYDKVERSFDDAHYAFVNICGNLHVDYAARVRIAILFRKCARNGLTRGRERFALIIAISEIVCTEIGIARDFDYIINYFGADSASVSAYKRGIEKMLEKEALPNQIWGYIKMALYAANANDNAFRIAKALLTNIVKGDFENAGRKDPKTIAGIIAYKAMKQAHIFIKQKDVAAILNISERGLRRYIKIRF